MSKRKNGEGSWGTKKIGKYTYRYYRDSNGNYTYGKTVKEINEKLSHKKANEFFLNDKTTFGEYIQNWLKTKVNTIEYTTYDCYETMIRSQILNFKDYDLTNKQLSNLSSTVFKNYLDALAERYSRSTIQKIWTIIRQCVSYGEINNEIPPNTTKLVKIPIESNVKVKKKVVPFLTKDQVEQLYTVSQQKYNNGDLIYGNNAKAILLIVYTGMRVSEAIALKWKNVDIKNKKVCVVSSSATIKNRNKKSEDDKKYITYDKIVKTDESNRTIPLPQRAVEVIEYFDKFNKNHTDNDYVCVSKTFTKLSRWNINRTLEAMSKKADIDIGSFSVHSLRHTYGSILLREGVDIKTVSKLLGHSDISVTYNIYIGILEEDKQSEVERVFDSTN